MKYRQWLNIHRRYFAEVSMYSLAEQSKFSADGNSLCPILHAQFGVNIADVALDRGNGNHQFCGDLLIGTPCFDEL